MTDDERAARKWLNNYRNHINGIDGEKHIDLILRLLDRPVMPRSCEVPNDVCWDMERARVRSARDHGFKIGTQDMRAAIDVLHAHLTAPPPKKRENVIGQLRYWLDDDSTPVECKADITRAITLLQEAADADA